MLLEWSSQMAMILIYLGFAGVFGYLLRRSLLHGRSLEWFLVAFMGVTLVLPATTLILGYQPWSPIKRGAVFLIAISAAGLLIRQPLGTPTLLTSRSFRNVYFGLAMVCTALWGLSSLILAPSPGPLMLGLASSAAGTASILSLQEREP